MLSLGMGWSPCQPPSRCWWRGAWLQAQALDPVRGHRTPLPVPLDQHHHDLPTLCPAATGSSQRLGSQDAQQAS